MVPDEIDALFTIQSKTISTLGGLFLRRTIDTGFCLYISIGAVAKPTGRILLNAFIYFIGVSAGKFVGSRLWVLTRLCLWESVGVRPSIRSRLGPRTILVIGGWASATIALVSNRARSVIALSVVSVIDTPLPSVVGPINRTVEIVGCYISCILPRCKYGSKQIVATGPCRVVEILVIDGH